MERISSCISLARNFAVVPGDKVDAEVYAYHETSSGYNNSTTRASMIKAVAGAFDGVQGAGARAAIFTTHSMKHWAL